MQTTINNTINNFDRDYLALWAYFCKKIDEKRMPIAINATRINHYAIQKFRRRLTNLGYVCTGSFQRFQICYRTINQLTQIERDVVFTLTYMQTCKYPPSLVLHNNN